MFFVIKHQPTDTYIPFLNNPYDRSKYYSFLDSKNDTFNVRMLDFRHAHKYSSIDIAYDFISRLILDKLRSQHSVDDFTVTKYEFYPIEHLTLNNKSTWDHISLMTAMDNWRDISNIYCSFCGSYIPPNIKYVTINNATMCPHCVSDMHNQLNESVIQYKNTELMEAIITERFISKL